jgi:hypothetical protein
MWHTTEVHVHDCSDNARRQSRARRALAIASRRRRQKCRGRKAKPLELMEVRSGSWSGCAGRYRRSIGDEEAWRSATGHDVAMQRRVRSEQLRQLWRVVGWHAAGEAVPQLRECRRRGHGTQSRGVGTGSWLRRRRRRHADGSEHALARGDDILYLCIRRRHPQRRGGVSISIGDGAGVCRLDFTPHRRHGFGTDCCEGSQWTAASPPPADRQRAAHPQSVPAAPSSTM